MMTSRSGFTLVEVMIALAITALSLSALAGLEISLTRSTTKASARLARMERMSYFWNEINAELIPREKRVKRRFDEPLLQCVYEQQQIPKKSSLKDIKDIVIERITGSWIFNDKKRQELLISFRYIPQEEDDETRNNAH